MYRSDISNDALQGKEAVIGVSSYEIISTSETANLLSSFTQFCFML